MKLRSIGVLFSAVVFMTACGADNKSAEQEGGLSANVEQVASEKSSEKETLEANKGQSVGATEQEKIEGLNTLDQRFSYMLGNNLVRQFKPGDIKFDIDAITMGIKDAVDGSTPRLSEAQVQAVLQGLQQRAEERQKVVADKNKADGEAFLAENAKKEGVVVTDSGLQYKVIQQGKGEKPSAQDEVTVHYAGKLIDGTEFDSSIARGEPTTFPVSGVIPGWVEALQLMSKGDKWELIIPSDLAYGMQGAGDKIGPNSVLVFEVELLDIKKAVAQPEQPVEPESAAQPQEAAKADSKQ